MSRTPSNMVALGMKAPDKNMESGTESFSFAVKGKRER
jgi:hypothetical protein